MTQSNNPIKGLTKKIVSTLVGFVVALPFAFAWLFVGQVLSQVFESIASFIQVGFFAFGYSFAVWFSIVKTNQWLKRVQAGLGFGLLSTILALVLFYIRPISIQVLVSILGLQITTGTLSSLGFGFIFGTIGVKLSKNSQDSLSDGCAIALVSVLFGIVGFFITQLATIIPTDAFKNSPASQLKLLEFPYSAMGLAIIAGLLFGIFRVDSKD